MIITISRRTCQVILALLAIISMAAAWQVYEFVRLQPIHQSAAYPGFQGTTVVIDPGHGGADPGAMTGKIKEADINMGLALALQERLQKAGARVIMTRQGDRGLVSDQVMTYFLRWWNLEKRKKLARSEQAGMLISLHVDSNSDERVAGGFVYYGDERSRALANLIQQRLNLLSGKKRPVAQSKFTLINGNDIPSVLIEAGFITNKNDRELLMKHPDTVAASIYDGVSRYVFSDPANNLVRRRV